MTLTKLLEVAKLIDADILVQNENYLELCHADCYSIFRPVRRGRGFEWICTAGGAVRRPMTYTVLHHSMPTAMLFRWPDCQPKPHDGVIECKNYFTVQARALWSVNLECTIRFSVRFCFQALTHWSQDIDTTSKSAVSMWFSILKTRSLPTQEQSYLATWRQFVDYLQDENQQFAHEMAWPYRMYRGSPPS